MPSYALCTAGNLPEGIYTLRINHSRELQPNPKRLARVQVEGFSAWLIHEVPESTGRELPSTEIGKWMQRLRKPGAMFGIPGLALYQKRAF
jgi:hypothetical protein